jgi:MoaA/NifB/PqqE/SkfB family radical SAM enzyme
MYSISTCPFCKHNLEDIVKYAHEKGFLAAIIYTNGTLPIATSADTVFISLDGLQKTHELHTWRNI